MSRSSRSVAFAGRAIEVAFCDSGSRRVVDMLYRHVPAAAETPAHVVFEIEGCEDGYALSVGGEPLYQGLSAAELAKCVMEHSVFHLADKCTSGVLLHAAAVAWEGQGIVIPGVTGAGKSTLAGWLAGSGFDVLTDELACVPLGSRRISGFSRPVSLRHPAVELLAARPGLRDIAEQGTAAFDGLLVPIEALCGRPPPAEAPLSLLAFPRYEPKAALSVRPLSQAEAGLRLMGCNLNARNFPDHGLAEVERIAAAAPAVELVYSSLEGVDAALRGLLGGAAEAADGGG